MRKVIITFLITSVFFICCSERETYLLEPDFTDISPENLNNIEWKLLEFPGNYISDMLISPAGIIYTIDESPFPYDGSAIWHRSTDNGLTWTALDKQYIAVLDYAFITDNLFYVTGYHSWGSRFSYSTDQGDSWTDISIKYSRDNVWTFAVGKRGILYASFHEPGKEIYHFSKSTDGGLSWQEMNYSTPRFDRIDIDENNRLYATLVDVDRTSGSPVFTRQVHTSDDEGITWEQIYAYESVGPTVITVFSSHEIYLQPYFGLLFVSQDSGQDWREIKVHNSINIVKSEIREDGVIAVFTQEVESGEDIQKLYISLDQGNNWTNIDIPPGRFYEVKLSPDNFLYISTAYEIYRSLEAFSRKRPDRRGTWR